MVLFFVLSTTGFRASQIFLQCAVYGIFFVVYILLDFFVHVPPFEFQLISAFPWEAEKHFIF